jgi:bis(5'-nucleosyl)-tetraphosphatase (symmetrical)
MAKLAEKALQSDHYLEFFKVMYGNKPNKWSSDLKDGDKIRFIINCFTRLRYCDKEGQLDFSHTGAIGTQPKHLMPWFAVPHRQSSDINIIFGHWSSLGYYHQNNVYGIDTGCLWGGQLTAIKLGKTIKKFSVESSVKKTKAS